MKKHNGFTLVELLVVLGLSSIIISLFMSFFIFNYKNYKYISNEAELQFQAQYILNFMSDKILESKYIELARENLTSHLKKSGEYKLTKISFRYGTNPIQCYNFENKNNKIFYGNCSSTNSSNVELGDYVYEMYACPIPQGAIFQEAEAIKIRLLLSKANQSYETEQIVYMRNN